ncbi:MAG: ABC transporter permease [Caldiserica bacterium]|nr:ABC transporter permease [Caldisericota bacterium]
MRAFVALLVAEFKHFFRERMALFWMFLFPIFFMLLFGFVFGGDGEDRVSLRLGVVVEGQGPATEGLLRGLSRIPLVSEVHVGTREEELSALRERKRDGVLIVPGDLWDRLRAGEKSRFVLYYDASRTTTYRILISVMQEFLARSEEVLTGRVRSLELAPEPVQVRRFRAIDYMVPGILAMTLMQLGLFGVAGTLVARREHKILRRFWAAPLRRSVFAGALISHRLAVSLIQAALILAVAVAVFDVALVGSYALMAGVVLLGAVTFVSLGYMIASFARSVEGSNALLQIINFPMMFLSGIFWPIEWMPGFLRPVIYALPLTYLGDALRQVMVGATPLVPLWIDVAVLGGWTVATAALSMRFFRWE